MPTPETNRSEPGPLEYIEARGLGFHYENAPPLLSRVDTKLDRGHIASLIAETGAGKSTLGLLLAGILKPTVGRVAINGDSGTTPATLAAGRILYVGSKPVLVPGSIEDNLYLGHEKRPSSIDRQEIESLFSLFRDRRPVSLTEPLIDANGMGVSSGQAQLIQLVRAVLAEPEFVIFDEATSSLDMPNEAAVQARLLDWCKRRICLVISHRQCPWVDAATTRLKL